MPSTPWQPSRATTIVLGILTVWPILYFFLFLGVMFFSFASMTSPGHPPRVFELFRYIVPLHLLTMLLMFALTAVYVVHAFRSDRIAEDKRVLWVVVLFFGNMIAFPIYWYLYLWRGGGGRSPSRTAPYVGQDL